VSREISVETDHLRLAARVWGPDDGVRVLALHGWLDNAATFDRLAPLLCGVRLVALDLPGHGRSEHRPPGCSYHYVDWIAVVLAAADALGWSRYALLGHSMGAGIATLVPAVVPERIERVVLIEGLGPLSRAAEEVVRGLREAIVHEERAGDAAARIFATFDAAVAARMAGTDLDREAAAILVDRGSERVDGGVRFRHDPRLRLRSRLRLTEDQVLAFVAAISCPVLAVRATAGWPFPEELLAARKAAVPRLEEREVEGGHHLHLTHPERVAQVVGDFLLTAVC
jgi:pimeloyl-ACP methyl ester carboxylesterase